MPRSNDAALEKREGRFHGVCVNVAVSVFLGVVDRVVLVLLNLVERARVDRGFVGHDDFHVAADIGVDDLSNSLRLCVLRPESAADRRCAGGCR